MPRRPARPAATALPIAAALALAIAAAASPPPLVTGIDHVVVAVADLDRAAATFAAIGFSIKPGRPHANGIRNAHVKLEDGSEIELLTVDAPGDALAAEYARHLARGEGPAFAILHAPDRAALIRRLTEAGRRATRAGGLVSFPEGAALRHLAFGGRNRSPTDRPGHLRHANAATSLVAVWIAADAGGHERALLESLGARVSEDSVHAPAPRRAAVARLGEGDVVLLPAAARGPLERPIVGATVRTRDLAAARRALARAGIAVGPVVRTARGASVFVPAAAAHGLSLELCEMPGR